MDPPTPIAPQPARLLDRVRQACRVRHYPIRTEEAYHDWARRFILFHGRRHPQEMGEHGCGGRSTSSSRTRPPRGA